MYYDSQAACGGAGRVPLSARPPLRAPAAAAPRRAAPRAGVEGSAQPARRGTPLPPAEGTETLTAPAPGSPPGPRGRPRNKVRRIGAPPGPNGAEDAEDADAEDAESAEDAFDPALGCKCSPSSSKDGVKYG